MLNRITSILISRFLLNLQAAEHTSTGMVSSTDSGSQVESVIFQRVIGSLGNTVEFGADADADVFEQYCVRGEDDSLREGDVENSLSGRDHTEGGVSEEAAADD